MANINPIANGETGISVRNKLNALITKAQTTSGSLNILSGSFEDFSGSYVTESGSFAERITDNSGSIAVLSSSFLEVSSSFLETSASYYEASASFSASIAELSASLEPLSGSIALLSSSFEIVSASYYEASASFSSSIAELSASLQPLSASIALLSSSYEDFSASYNSGSFTGSFEGEFTGSLLGTGSYALTASVLNFDDNDKEIHVSADNGVDSVGRGTLLYPYKTLTYALTRIGNGSGFRVIVHRGQYAENITITQTNMSIIGYQAGNGSLVEINGHVTVNVPSPASTRISNIRLNRLTHQNTGNLFVDNVTVTLQATFGAPYAEIVDSRFECSSGIQHNAAGRLLVFGSNFSPLTTSHASAISFLKDNISIVQPTLTAGTLAIVNSNVTGIVANQPAINTSVNTFLSLVNSQVSTATGVPARINVGGFLSYDNIVFDKKNSTLGTQVPIVARFQTIDANLLQITGSASVSGSATITGNTTIGGDLVVDGKITAKVFESQLISSSVIYESGSTKFGDTIDDTHQFTGSVLISGSLIVNSVQIASASIASGSISNAVSASYIPFSGVEGLLDYTSSISASITQLSSSFEIVSSSFEIVSSSFQVVSSSYAESSASFSASIAELSSSFVIVSASYYEASASFSASIVELSSSISPLSASIASLSSSFVDFSASYMSGSFSGSFEGDGSKLTGLSAGFPYTGSAEISGSLTVTGSVNISGSLTVNGVAITNNGGGGSISGEYLGSGSLSSGSISNIFLINPSGSRSAVLDYHAQADMGNMRTGQMLLVLNNVEVKFNEYTTSDLMPTDDLELELDMVYNGVTHYDLVLKPVQPTELDYIVKYRLRFL